MLVVTTDTLPGYEIREVLGEVIGVTARTHNPFAEGIKSLHGGTNPKMVEILTGWREEAVERMAQIAQKRGGNAVVGMRFDHREVTTAWVEICAYGTAVLVAHMAREDGGRPAAPGASSSGASSSGASSSGASSSGAPAGTASASGPPAAAPGTGQADQRRREAAPAMAGGVPPRPSPHPVPQPPADARPQYAQEDQPRPPTSPGHNPQHAADPPP